MNGLTKEQAARLQHLIREVQQARENMPLKSADYQLWIEAGIRLDTYIHFITE